MSSSISSAQPNDAAIATGRFKPLVSLFNHKWLAFFIIVAVMSAGIPIVWEKGTPTYIVYSVILISAQSASNLDEKSSDLRGQEYLLYSAQQEHMLTREDVLQEALQIPNVRALWVRPDEDDKKALKRLKAAIDTSSSRRNPLITVSLEDEKAEGLEVVLNAIVDIYLRKSQAENLYDSDGRIVTLKTRRDQLSRLIPEWNEQRTKIAQELGVTTFKEGVLNPYDKILIDSTSSQVASRQHRVEAEAYLSALYKRNDKGATVLDSLAQQIVSEDSVLKSFKTKIMQRRADLTTETLNMTHEHPGRQQADQEIAKLERDLEQTTNETLAEVRKQLIAKYKANIQQAASVEQALMNEVNIQQKQATYYASRYNEALLISRDLERAYDQLRQLNNRIDFLSIESHSPGFARLDTLATPTTQAQGTGRKKLVLLLIVMALGLGIATPLLLDIIDRRVRTPNEVQKILGFSPLAWILERKDEVTRQFTLDQLRRLAFTLHRERSQHQNRCFALTPVKPGCGTTTLVLELAHHLNLLGLRTLAVELNAFNPDSRYCDHTQGGLHSLLNYPTISSNMLNSLIIPATETLPDRLPVGSAAQRHLMATSGQLNLILTQLKNQYDLILLDSPPILLSADAELLGDIADCILLIIEAEQVEPSELKRAAHLLERLNPPSVGAIINRIKVYKGDGYLSSLLKEYSTGKKVRRNWFTRLIWH